MAYKNENLSVLAYANGFTLWHYTTPDAAGTIDTDGYFNDAATMLRPGDMVLANTETGGTAKAGLFLVNSATAASVDVADMLQVGGTDTD